MKKVDLKLSPFDYQIEDAKYILASQKFALCHEPGVGKTFGVMLAIQHLVVKEGIQALVVVPPILISTWYDKFNEYFNHNLVIVKYLGTKSEREKLRNNLHKADVVICSYDIFRAEGVKAKRSQSAEPKDYISGCMPRLNFLVGDESKFLKNTESSKFKTFNILASKCDYMVLMNGTPVTKHPGDLYSIIQLINPRMYVTYKNFLRVHAVYSQDMNGYPTIVGWKNLEPLKKAFSSVSRRLVKQDVLKDLPPKQLIIKQVDLEPEHEQRVRRLLETGLLEIQQATGPELIFAQAQELQMKVRRALFDPSIVSLDVESNYFGHLDLLVDNLGDEQAILFCHFHQTLDKVKQYLTSKKISFGEIHGQVSQKAKEQAKADFINKKVQYLIGNAKSMGVGLDFQHSRNVIFFELDYEVDSFWQGQDRVHRPGQREDVNIYVFIAKHTIAVKLFKSVVTNTNFVQQLLNRENNSSFLNDAVITSEELEYYTRKINGRVN